MYIIFDTETTGLPRNWNAPITDTDNWPRAIQIAWQLHDLDGNLIEAKDFLVKPEGFDIPYDAERIHGISTQLAVEMGEDAAAVFQLFNEALGKATFVVGQNVGFDKNIMGSEFIRFGIENRLQEMPVLDTCTEITANLCQIPEVVVENSNYQRFPNFTITCLINRLRKHTTPLPMWKQQPVVFSN